MVSGVYDPTAYGTSLAHAYARLATTGEVYNYALQTTFAGTLSDSWAAAGGTIAASAVAPFYQTNALELASATTSVYQIVTFPITKGEIFSFSCMAKGTGDYTITVTEYNGATAGDGTAETYTLDATSYRYVSVTHTATSSSSDRIRVTIAKSAGNAGYIDCPMLNYGQPVFFYVANTETGTSGVGSYNDRAAGYYDTCGTDVDEVDYTHPWAVIQPQAAIWNHVVALSEACAARFVGIDSSGCFVMRSGISGTDPTTRTITGQASTVAASIRPSLNQLSVRGAYISKGDKVETVWSLDATGADAENAITIANGAYYPAEGSIEATYNNEPIADPPGLPASSIYRTEMVAVSEDVYRMDVFSV
jgi:hypothetical protein